jgi:pimeloyl-ACP methyl ester carboxylesterase
MRTRLLSRAFKVLAALGLATACASPADHVDGIVVMRSADGLPLSAEVRGEGEPAVVFIHGWSCDRTYWLGQMVAFAPAHRVVAIDLGGHGGSGLDRSEWTISSFATDVQTVVEQLDLESAVLVGHSLGGAVAVEAALLMPDRVVAVVGVDTFMDDMTQLTDDMTAPWLEGWQRDFAGFTAEVVRTGLFLPTTDSALVAAVVADMAAAPPKVAIPAIQSLWAWGTGRFGTAIDSLDVPLRIIQSEANARLDFVTARAQHLPSFGVSIVSGVSHFLMMEVPEQFNGELAAAIEDALHTASGAVTAE